MRTWSARPSRCWPGCLAAEVRRIWARYMRWTGYTGRAGARNRRPKPTTVFYDSLGRRAVVLRNERKGEDQRHLRAHLDEEGNLVVEGQDLGPGTALISDDGEYEYQKRIAAADIASLRSVLNIGDDVDILDELGCNWSGPASYELERRIRESRIPVQFFSWGG